MFFLKDRVYFVIVFFKKNTSEDVFIIEVHSYVVVGRAIQVGVDLTSCSASHCSIVVVVGLVVVGSFVAGLRKPAVGFPELAASLVVGMVLVSQRIVVGA
jgi:hypothetical protein